MPGDAARGLGMLERRLICSADDFGFGRRITDAIIDCHVNGIISSTTLIANMPAAGYACARAREVPSLGVGVHLTLTEGRPVLPPEEVPDLVDEQGKFLPSRAQRNNLWRGKRRVAQQVEREFSAQIEQALALGIRPTHCDSHHGIHKLPLALKAMIRALRRRGIQRARTQVGYYWTGPRAPLFIRLLRIYRNLGVAPQAIVSRWNHQHMRRSGLHTPDRKVSRPMFIPRLSDPREHLLRCLANLPRGTSEMIFHPGYPDPEVEDPPDFESLRRGDAAVASDPEVVRAIGKYRIELISFRDL